MLILKGLKLLTAILHGKVQRQIILVAGKHRQSSVNDRECLRKKGVMSLFEL